MSRLSLGFPSVDTSLGDEEIGGGCLQTADVWCAKPAWMGWLCWKGCMAKVAGRANALSCPWAGGKAVEGQPEVPAPSVALPLIGTGKNWGIFCLCLPSCPWCQSYTSVMV